jgi:hypothetical protein
MVSHLFYRSIFTFAAVASLLIHFNNSQSIKNHMSQNIVSGPGVVLAGRNA